MPGTCFKHVSQEVPICGLNALVVFFCIVDNILDLPYLSHAYNPEILLLVLMMPLVRLAGIVSATAMSPGWPSNALRYGVSRDLGRTIHFGGDAMGN